MRRTEPYKRRSLQVTKGGVIEAIVGGSSAQSRGETKKLRRGNSEARVWTVKVSSRIIEYSFGQAVLAQICRRKITPNKANDR